MKQMSTFLLFAVLLSSSSVFAQKSTVYFGGMYVPKSENFVKHAFLGYYHHITGRHSIGVKTMFSTGKLRDVDDHVKVFAGNFDLVHRWTFIEKGGRSKLNVEAGLSFGGTKHKSPYATYGFCGTGLTDEMIWEIEQDIRRKRGIIFRTGIASAASWEFALSPHFGFGFGATVNVYLSPIDGFQFLTMPNLNAAYSF